MHTEENYWADKQYYAGNQQQSEMNRLIQSEEMNLSAMLKPRITIDGNQYCVLYGENLQDGIAGFGDTAYHAILDFNKNFHEPIHHKK